MLREVAEALQQGPEVRQLAVSVLKNLLIKHAMDDRYTAFKVREDEALDDDGRKKRREEVRRIWDRRVGGTVTFQNNSIWRMMHSSNTNDRSTVYPSFTEKYPQKST